MRKEKKITADDIQSPLTAAEVLLVVAFLIWIVSSIVFLFKPDPQVNDVASWEKGIGTVTDIMFFFAGMFFVISVHRAVKCVIQVMKD